jgi:hypothetical protein
LVQGWMLDSRRAIQVSLIGMRRVLAVDLAITLLCLLVSSSYFNLLVHYRITKPQRGHWPPRWLSGYVCPLKFIL